MGVLFLNKILVGILLIMLLFGLVGCLFNQDPGSVAVSYYKMFVNHDIKNLEKVFVPGSFDQVKDPQAYLKHFTDKYFDFNLLDIKVEDIARPSEKQAKVLLDVVGDHHWGRFKVLMELRQVDGEWKLVTIDWQ